MSMGGNLTNNGTLNLAPTATRICDITFNKNGNQTISGAGATTNFNNIMLNMGASNANVLNVASTNFTVLPTNFLTITNGTLKISTATAAITPFTGAYTIPATGGLWLNNAGATVSIGNTVTLYGYLRVSAGTVNIGNASDENLTSYGGVITIDGGTVNIAGSLTKAGPTILTYFTMSSGTLKVATVGSTTALAPFQMDEIGSTFNMSGGTIIIERTGAGNMGYINTGGTVGSVTGGTLQMGDASTLGAPTMQINSSIPIYNLTVSNGVAVTAQLATNSVTVKNNVTINSGTLNANTLNITAGGNWTNSGTFTASTGTVAFNGTAAQTITGTTKFYNLTFSNTFATAPQISFAAATDVIVGNTLSLGSNDQVNLNGRTLTIGTSAAATGTLTYASGFLYGGNITRWMALATYAVNNAKGHFPIGTSAGDYRPFFLGITTANLTTGGTVTLSHTAVYPAAYNVASHTDVTWTPPVGGTVLQGESQSSWNVSTGGGIVAAAGTRFDISFGGAGFGTNTLTDIDATLAASTVGTFAAATGIATAVMANRTGLTLAQLNNGGTQNFLLGTKNINQSPLPVELLSFDAKPDGNVVDVTWKTASEFNSAYFVVQRSKDGTVFNDVAQEQGVGNSSTVKKYSAVDHEPYNDVSYYRLKQVDNDGKFTYSGLVAVKFHNENVILVYPNPSFQGEPINVSISGQNGKEVLVVVHDLQGKEFYSKVIIFSSDVEAIAIDPSGKLAPGVYFVVATSDNNIYEKKIVIK
jgi:hypothetical protein